MKYGDALRVLARLEGVPEPAVLQSIVLYNRNFGVIIRNKLRRAEFLDSLLA